MGEDARSPSPWEGRIARLRDPGEGVPSVMVPSAPHRCGEGGVGVIARRAAPKQSRPLRTACDMFELRRRLTPRGRPRLRPRIVSYRSMNFSARADGRCSAGKPALKTFLLRRHNFRDETAKRTGPNRTGPHGQDRKDNRQPRRTIPIRESARPCAARRSDEAAPPGAPATTPPIHRGAEG